MRSKKFYKLFIIFNVFILNGKQSKLTKAIQNKYWNFKADFVIIGVGNAGALMANRLSTDLTTSVIALHEGDNLDDDPIIKFSKNAAITVPSSLLDTNLYNNGPTTIQANANNRIFTWTVALPKGGATAINAGAWTRQTPIINNQWQNLDGPNWSNQKILDIYKELEAFFGQTTNTNSRGFNGPLSIRQTNDTNLISAKLTSAMSTMLFTPIPQILDYNDPNSTIGACPQVQYTQSIPTGDLRISSAAAFLNNTIIDTNGKGINGRKLQVLFKAKALKTIWSGNTAIGVEFLMDGKIQKAIANKAIIICAGLMSSPFLMHSGIGDSTLLEPLSIPVKFDNPNVGQNLIDQPSLHIAFSANPDDTAIPSLDTNSPFIQIANFPDPDALDQTIRAFRLGPLNPTPGVVLCLLDLVQPKSRGKIYISNSDPLQPPIVDPGYLNNSDDLDLFVRILQKTIKNLNTRINQIDDSYMLISPDPDTLNDIAKLQDYIRDNINPNFVYHGHCKMADLMQNGVVDNSGRVYINNNGDTTNIYVADASVIPFCDATTMAPTYMVAENIASMIIDRYKT